MRILIWDFHHQHSPSLTTLHYTPLCLILALANNVLYALWSLSSMKTDQWSFWVFRTFPPCCKVLLQDTIILSEWILLNIFMPKLLYFVIQFLLYDVTWSVATQEWIIVLYACSHGGHLRGQKIVQLWTGWIEERGSLETKMELNSRTS